MFSCISKADRSDPQRTQCTVLTSLRRSCPGRQQSGPNPTLLTSTYLPQRPPSKACLPRKSTVGFITEEQAEYGEGSVEELWKVDACSFDGMPEERRVHTYDTAPGTSKHGERRVSYIGIAGVDRSSTPNLAQEMNRTAKRLAQTSCAACSRLSRTSSERQARVKKVARGRGSSLCACTCPGEHPPWRMLLHRFPLNNLKSPCR